ncbi:MAG TPA: DUF2066 domain-containing protein [Gammaproteobacteria bacterium]|nr:DUF2066 domain-containing protein [Gammaproteobacteria bacterium]
MSKSTIFRLLLALCLLPTMALGAEVRGLYEAEMLVPDQSRSERGLAMSAALAQVVTKVSGRRDARLQPKVAQAIRRPARLLQQYRYRTLPAAQRGESLPGDDPQLLFFQFDKKAVDKLLHDSGLPVWGATRPAVLAWLAVEDGGRRYLLGADSPGELRRLVAQEAKRRGLSLLLPLLDLQDQHQVSFADVWGRFRDPVLAASQRYRPEAVLMGRLQRTADGEWLADWWIIEGRDSEQWRANGVLPAEVVEEGMAGAVSWLAQRYAPQPGSREQGHLQVTVDGVRSLADFARVEGYLQSLQQVEHIRVRQLGDGRVDFSLALQGSPEGVAQTIALGQVLAPVAPQGEPVGGDVSPGLPTDSQHYLLRH